MVGSSDCDGIQLSQFLNIVLLYALATCICVNLITTIHGEVSSYRKCDQNVGYVEISAVYNLNSENRREIKVQVCNFGSLIK